MTQTIRFGIAVTVVAFATASWAEVQTIYRPTDLGTLGGSYSQACDINEHGQVVGYSYIAGDAAYRGFIWDRTNGIVPLGTLGGTNSYAYGLNNLGQVVARANMFTQALTHELELDSAVVPYWGNHNAVGEAKRKYGPELEADIHRAEGDVILRYLGAETTARDILREFNIRTRPEFYSNEHLL